MAPLGYHDDPSWTRASESPASEAAVVERFADTLARRIRLHATVALSEGEPLSPAAGILEPAARDTAGRGEGWIGLFECVPGPQGEEAGLAVLADTRRWLRRRGADRIVGPRTGALLPGPLVEGSWVLGDDRSVQRLADQLGAGVARRFELFTWEERHDLAAGAPLPPTTSGQAVGSKLIGDQRPRNARDAAYLGWADRTRSSTSSANPSTSSQSVRTWSVEVSVGFPEPSAMRRTNARLSRPYWV